MSLENGDGIRGKWRYDASLDQLIETRPSTNIYTHAIIGDTIDPLMHPATGETYDSKSAFRRKTKELGYIEIDDDKTWRAIGERRQVEVEGLREDIEEVKHWYTNAMKGNRDYLNANVPQELRDCEEVDPDDITRNL